MQPLIIRPMTEQDIPATARVLADAFNSCAARSEEQLAQKPAQGMLMQAFVALRGDQVIGMSLCEKNKNALSIQLLAVNQNARKQGVGRKLMAHTEKFMARHWVEDDQADVIIEDLTKLRNNMSRYYENMGYKEWFGMSEGGCPLLYKTLQKQKPLSP